jgi:prophage regulatory protein
MRDANTSVSNTATADPSVFLRMKAVTKMTGLGRSTIYRLVAQDKFPSPVKLADRAVAWRRADLERWSEERPSAH